MAQTAAKFYESVVQTSGVDASRDAQTNLNVQVKSDKMHDESRHICMLLMFATAYNMDGLPLLLDHSCNYKYDQDEDAYDQRASPARVLNALATAFVQNDEIIAAAEFFPDIVVTLQNPEWSDDSGTLPLEDSGIFMIPCQGYSLNVVEPVLDKGQWWDYVCKQTSSSDFTLAAHMETVFSFMSYLTASAQKRSSSDSAGASPDLTVDLEFRFSSYIIASCCRKMQLRISSWVSIGFIFHLFSIHDDDILETHRSRDPLPSHANRSDRLLVLMLRTISPDEVRHLAQHYPRGGPVNFDNLGREWNKQASAKEAYTIYNEATCIEFHQFLVAILMSYATALTEVNRSCSVTDRRKWLPLVHNFACLLWQVIESRAFRLHLDTLSELLKMPSYRTVSAYQTFATSHDLHFTDASGMRGPDERYAFQDEADTFLAAFSKGTDPSMVFARFIRNQVISFRAISVLGQHCAVVTPPEIGQTIQVVPLPPSNQFVSWEGIEAVLKSVSSDAMQQGHLEEVITGIITQKYYEGAKIHYIFEKVGQIKDSGQQGVRYPGVVHCEAALASSFSSSGLAVQGNGISTDLPHLTKLEGQKANTIAASNSCCAVCGELFQILQKREEGLCVPDRHLTVYPVELPRWLPHDILETLLQRLKEHLTVELGYMLQKYQRLERGHIRIPSRESSPASSTFGRSLLAFQSNQGPVKFSPLFDDMPAATSSQSKADKHLTPRDVGVFNGLISIIRARFTRK